MNANIEKLFNLSGKTAIVTGGAMGIGKGIARRLAEAGAGVMIVDLVSKEDAQQTLDEFQSNGHHVAFLQADLRDISRYEAILSDTLQKFGSLDILINNAGIFNYAPVSTLSEDLWDRTIDLNLKATAFLSKAFIKSLAELKKGGRIINISSVDSMKPTGNLSHYDASKGGVRMLTRALAKEAAQFGILVNEIAPGGVNTPGVMKMAGTQMSEEQIEAMKAQSQAFMKMLPLHRMGEPEEIGNAALFLASEASTYMTGSTLVVDGGMLLM
jgi:2-deoxy-D-gluconate 3-dehydrogenase